MNCDECANKLMERGEFVFLPGYGYFHPGCLSACPCGIDWPRSLVSSGDVRFACNGCARAAA